MRRDFVYWAFALAVGVSLAVAFVPALAYTPEELLKGRQDVFDCPEGKEVCTVKRKDVEWVLARDLLLNKLLEHAAAQYQKCGGRNL